MTITRGPLIVPVEMVYREIDGRLLLSCFAAERGHPVIFGAQRPVHFGVMGYARGVYLAKALTPKKVRIIRIFRQLGHCTAALDEEGLLPGHVERFYEQRVSASALQSLSAVFSWGPESTRLLSGYPGLPRELEIRETGNPRIDLLRPQFRGYFAPEVDALRSRFGRFILVNSNFPNCHHFLQELSHQMPEGDLDALPAVEAYTARRLAWAGRVYLKFTEAVAALSRAFPGHMIVVRPHPSESPESWEPVVAGLPNARLVLEGNVVPWLLAADVVIQNGSTTGIEACLLQRPVIAYRPVIQSEHELMFPNEVSFEVTAEEALIEAVRRAVADGRLPVPPGAQAALEARLASLRGPLACERIVEGVDALLERGLPPRKPLQAMRGYLQAGWRGITKRIGSRIAVSSSSLAYTEYKFPGISLTQVRDRVDRFRRLLGRFDSLRVTQLTANVFRLSRG